MRSLRRLLSPCNSKSPMPFGHSSHSRFPDHPPDPQFHFNQDKVLPTPLMSLRPRRITSSYLQSCFDLTLTEYSKETGINLIKHPIVATLDGCDCVDAVIAAILEQTRSNDSRIDCSIVELLMGQLKSTLQTVFWLSPTDALGDNIDLRFTPAKAIFASIGVLLAEAEDSGANYDALVDLLDCIESILKPLRISTDIPPNMMVIMKAMKILYRLLLVLARATKLSKQGRLRKTREKLLEEEDVKRALRHLNRLTQEEVQTVLIQNMEVVYCLINNIIGVTDGGKGSIDEMQPALAIMQQILRHPNKPERDQLLSDFRKWLSPPDPSINHNFARRAVYKGTTTWFTQGASFKEWKATGSLLWINGKLGSGKTILCSSIIQDIKGTVDAGLASMAYFYCDFRDPKKQSPDGLLSSFLHQLCAQSDACCDVLFSLYSSHACGWRSPSIGVLTQCLRDMLKLLVQDPVYIVVDGLDECPGIPGSPSSRLTILRLIQELVNLHFSNLHICVLSHLSPDIEFYLAPLASRRVCHHEESGQMQDIIHYLRSMLNTHPKMRGWKASDKRDVVNKMFRKADGVFQWIVRQLDTLPRSLPATVVAVADRMPDTLDETYERILLRLPEENWEHTYHAFHCLMVATRPLTIEELALILAVDFIAEVTPKYEEIWRSEEPEDNLVTVCNTFLSFVNVDGSRIAQWAHYSVKEFLASERIANKVTKVARYRLVEDDAHTTVVQMSLAVLLHMDERIDRNGVKEIPMIQYASQNLAHHARFGDVANRVRAGLELLFDPNRPHLAAWIWLHDIDSFWGESTITAHPRRLDVAPLYYAAQAGFRDIAEHLLATHPQHLNTLGSRYGTPLIAALENNHLETAWLLLNRGADTSIKEGFYGPPLIVAAKRGHLDVVKFLLERGEDVNVWDSYAGTSLHLASGLGHLEMAHLLLRSGAEVNVQGGCYGTPLQVMSAPGTLGTAQLLHERNVDMNAQGGFYGTPLHAASADGHLEIARLLLELGADVNARALNSETPLHVASRLGHPGVVRLLLGYGADAGVEGGPGGTPLEAALEKGHFEVVRVLSEHGAARLQDVEDTTSFGG